VDFRSIGGKALAVVAKVGWPVALLAVLVFGGEVRQFAKAVRSAYLYGERGMAPADGGGVLTKPTEDTKGQPVDVIPAVPLPAPVAARLRRQTATLSAGTRFASEQAAEDAERRTGADLTGDGLAAGQTPEEVAEDRTDRGGAMGDELEKRHPAAETQIHLASGVVPPTGNERGGKADAIENPDTGAVSIIFTLDAAKRWGWPHEFEAAARMQFGDGSKWKLDAKNWQVEALYSPLRYRFVRIDLAGRHEDRAVVDSTGRVVEWDGQTYWIQARVRCRSLFRGECGP